MSGAQWRRRALAQSIHAEIRRQLDISDARQRRGENTILQERRVEVLRERLGRAGREVLAHGILFVDAEDDLRRWRNRERRIERDRGGLRRCPRTQRRHGAGVQRSFRCGRASGIDRREVR